MIRTGIFYFFLRPKRDSELYLYLAPNRTTIVREWATYYIPWLVLSGYLCRVILGAPSLELYDFLVSRKDPVRIVNGRSVQVAAATGIMV